MGFEFCYEKQNSGFDSFSKCISRGDGCRVIHDSPLKISTRTRLYRDIAPVIRTNRQEEYNILKF